MIIALLYRVVANCRRRNCSVINNSSIHIEPESQELLQFISNFICKTDQKFLTGVWTRTPASLSYKQLQWVNDITFKLSKDFRSKHLGLHLRKRFDLDTVAYNCKKSLSIV